MKQYLSLIWVLFILAACTMLPGVPISGSSSGTPPGTTGAVSSPVADTVSPTAPAASVVTLSAVTPPTDTPPAITPTLVITDTPDPSSSGMCAYMWATQDLPEVNAKLSQAYAAAGLTDIQAIASAYGENCMDPKSNKVLRFSAMETDFNLLIPVKNRTDTQEMGDRLAKALPVLDQFPVGQTPGPNPGYISVRFKDDTGEQNLHFLRTKGQDAIKQGLTGSALYNALINP